MQNDSRDPDLERELNTWAASQPEAAVSPELQHTLQNTLKPSLTPVKAVPSQGRLIFFFLLIFVAGAAGLTTVMDKTGLRLMTGVQIAIVSAILSCGGILFAIQLAGQMIPGSKQRMSLPVVLMLCAIGVAGGLAILFPWRTSNNFVADGWPCAAMELLTAAPAALVFWLLARRGALFASAGLGAALAGAAAFLTLIPLQFQCMFQQAPHLLLWHGGAALLVIALGALIGHLQHAR